MKPIPLHLQKPDSLRCLPVILQPGRNSLVVPLAPFHTQLQAFHLLLHFPLSKNEFSFVCVVKLLKLKHSATIVTNKYQSMKWKPTDVTILFVYCWVSTCFGPTGPSSGEFVLLFTQPLVQYLSALDACCVYRARVQSGQILNQWLCEQLYELSWRWACGPETCRDPAIYE